MDWAICPLMGKGSPCYASLLGPLTLSVCGVCVLVFGLFVIHWARVVLILIHTCGILHVIE